MALFVSESIEHYGGVEGAAEDRADRRRQPCPGRSPRTLRPRALAKSNPYRAQNIETLALARDLGYMTAVDECGEVVVRGRKYRGSAGFWFRVGQDAWAFYFPARFSPSTDVRSIRKLVGVTDLSPINHPGPSELLFRCRTRDALLLMAEGPRYVQARPSRRGPETGAKQGGFGPGMPEQRPGAPGISLRASSGPGGPETRAGEAMGGDGPGRAS